MFLLLMANLNKIDSKNFIFNLVFIIVVFQFMFENVNGDELKINDCF